MPDITNNLSAVRKQRAVSASALAALAGISRQTIYAIESGAYIPNTAVALRLAHVLSVTVHDLFSLPPPTEFFLSGAKPANFPGNRLLIAGCDPALALLARYLQPAGVELVLLHHNSAQSLSLLKCGAVQVAGTHLLDETTGQPNLSAITDSLTVISFAIWHEGLLTAPGNQKKITGIPDLPNKNVTFLNREPGAGTRTLLDSQLARFHIRPKQVRGYNRLAPGHLAAAKAIRDGEADCCLATISAARAFGLHFTPLHKTRYDLVLRKSSLDLPAVRCLLDTLARADFRKDLRSIAGYETAITGSPIC